MSISNPHNLSDAPSAQDGRYGIRVSLPDSEPLARLLPARWETYHWFADRTARDDALEDMRKRHRYSRMGDVPTVRYDPVER
jgi:hypothetical protein